MRAPVRARIRGNDEARFRFYENRGGADECWPWRGATAPNGYGHFQTSFPVRKHWTAHRYAYVRAYGPVPDDMVVHHVCRNRACVNPCHLEALSQREHAFQEGHAADIQSRKTHCAHGHPYDAKNTWLRLNGQRARHCRECNRIRSIYWNRVKAERRRAAR